MGYVVQKLYVKDAVKHCIGLLMVVVEDKLRNSGSRLRKLSRKRTDHHLVEGAKELSSIH